MVTGQATAHPVGKHGYVTRLHPRCRPRRRRLRRRLRRRHLRLRRHGSRRRPPRLILTNAARSIGRITTTLLQIGGAISVPTRSRRRYLAVRIPPLGLPHHQLLARTRRRCQLLARTRRR